MLQNHRTRDWTPEFFPQDFFSGTHMVIQPRARAVTLSKYNPMLQHKLQVSSSAWYKACGQEETSAERSRISRTALVIDAPVCQTLTPLWIPDSYHRQWNSVSIVAFLRLFIFGQVLKDQLLFVSFWCKCRNIGRSCRKSNGAAGMSAGDQNSALNFNCHCTKSGDTERGVNRPSH